MLLTGSTGSSLGSSKSWSGRRERKCETSAPLHFVHGLTLRFEVIIRLLHDGTDTISTILISLLLHHLRPLLDEPKRLLLDHIMRVAIIDDADKRLAESARGELRVDDARWCILGERVGECEGVELYVG